MNGFIRRDDSPEQVIASLLNMRETLNIGDACERIEVSLTQLGHDYDAPLWERVFDASNGFGDVMFEIGCEFWSFDWDGKESLEAQVALLAFEVAKGAGSTPAAFSLALAFDWVADERAETELREFITLHPQWEDPRLYGILGGLIANRYDGEECMREALTYLDRVEGTEEVWIRWRALAYAKLGQRDEAIALLKDQLLTKDPLAWRVLGDVHEASGERIDARSAYHSAIAAGDDGAARRLGFMFLEDGDVDSAVQAFAVAAARGDVISAKEINRIGMRDRDDGHTDKALARFAVGWEVGDLESGFDLAITLERIGRMTEARVLWKQMADYGDVAAMLRFGVRASSDGDLPVAQEYFRRALELGSEEQRTVAAGELGLTASDIDRMDP